MGEINGEAKVKKNCNTMIKNYQELKKKDEEMEKMDEEMKKMDEAMKQNDEEAKQELKCDEAGAFNPVYKQVYTCDLNGENEDDNLTLGKLKSLGHMNTIVLILIKGGQILELHLMCGVKSAALQKTYPTEHITTTSIFEIRLILNCDIMRQLSKNLCTYIINSITNFKQSST